MKKFRDKINKKNQDKILKIIEETVSKGQNATLTEICEKIKLEPIIVYENIKEIRKNIFNNTKIYNENSENKK